jgi:arylsulfatase A-like enzyme
MLEDLSPAAPAPTLPLPSAPATSPSRERWWGRFRARFEKNSKTRPRVFFWVAVTLLTVHALLFLGSLVALGHGATQAASRFHDVALEHHRAFLFWTNVDLLRGYAVVCLGYILLIYPVIRLWTSGIDVMTRKAILWRTLVLWIILMGWFWLRLIEVRPYFITAENYDQWFFKILSSLPDRIRSRVFFVLFRFLPGLCVLAAVLYYLTRTLVHLRPRWTEKAALAAALGICGVLMGGWFAAPLADSGPAEIKRPLSARPNVLILASDSLRGDRLSCNGYQRPTTPHIDTLAARGINFQKMLTPIASTLESLTSLNTGQYPHTHGLQHMYPTKIAVDRLLRQAPTLAGAMTRHGWETTVMGDWCAGVYHVVPLGYKDVIASDFDDFRLYMAQTVCMAHPILPLYFDNQFGYWMFPQLQSFASYVTPDVVTDRLLDTLDQRQDDGKPFFINAFYSCTHIPYYCPPPYHSRYSQRDYNGPNKFRMDFNVDKFIRGQAGEEFKKFPPEEVQQIKDLYDGCVNFFDDQVGRVIEHLKKTGLIENTIIIVTADHGDDLFEPNTTFSHGLSFNGGDQTNHVPFVCTLPGGKITPGGTVKRLTRTIDVAPTILDLCGLPPEPRFEGVSLRPYLEKPDSANLDLAFYGETSYLFFQRQITGEEPLHVPPLEETTQIDDSFDFHFVLKQKYADDVLRTKERCLRTESWKLIFTPGAHRPIFRLFDLRTDPHCQTPIQLTNVETWHTMEKALRLWVDEKKEQRLSELFPNGEPAAVISP